MRLHQPLTDRRLDVPRERRQPLADAAAPQLRQRRQQVNVRDAEFPRARVPRDPDARSAA